LEYVLEYSLMEIRLSRIFDRLEKDAIIERKKTGLEKIVTLTPPTRLALRGGFAKK
jgi:hypothetical protein